MKRSHDSLRRLAGKTALVTGGGTGIGRGIALAFSGEGCDVVICGRRAEPLAEVCTTAAALGGGKVTSLTCDQADDEAVTRCVAAAMQTLGERIDILVLNAGMNIPNRRLEKLDQLWE